MKPFVLERNIDKKAVPQLRLQVAKLQADEAVKVDVVLFTRDKLYLVVCAESKEVVRQRTKLAGLVVHRMGQVVDDPLSKLRKS